MARPPDPRRGALPSAPVSCDALVFDLRKNGGGEPAMIRLLSTCLFEEPPHLHGLCCRKGDQRVVLAYDNGTGDENVQDKERPPGRAGEVPRDGLRRAHSRCYAKGIEEMPWRRSPSLPSTPSV